MPAAHDRGGPAREVVDLAVRVAVDRGPALAVADRRQRQDGRHEQVERLEPAEEAPPDGVRALHDGRQRVPGQRLARADRDPAERVERAVAGRPGRLDQAPQPREAVRPDHRLPRRPRVGDVGREVLLHGRAGRTDGRDRAAHRLERLGRRRPDPVVAEPGDAEGADVHLVRVAESHRHDVRILAVRAGDEGQDQRQVLDPPRDRPELRERLEQAARARPVPGPRHAPARGLDPRDAAQVRGLADRVAAVAADVERRAAGGDDRRRATAAAAGRAAQVVRVRGPAVHVVVGLVGPRELGGVRLAHEDPARRTEPRDHRRVAVGDAVAPADGAGGRDDAGRVHRVLDRERDAVERAGRVTPREGRVGRPGPVAGVGGQPDHRVDVRVDGLDPGEAGVDGLERRDLPFANGRREPGRRS